MGSSTVSTGSGRRPLKSQSVLSQRSSRFFGAISFGVQAKEFFVKAVPHHGQALRGAGARLSRPDRYRRTRPTAVVSSASPLPPSRFGEASEPTHKPISIGQSPKSLRPLWSTFLGSA